MASVSSVAHPDFSPPWVDVTVSWDSDADVTVTRREPEGARPVRGAEPVSVTAGGSVTIRDYECPFGVPVTYQVTDGPAGVVADSFTLLEPTAFYPNDQGWSTLKGAVWLKHLTIPALSMPIDLANAESPAFTQTRTVVSVLNRPSPIVLADARRKNPTTTLDIRTWSLTEADTLRELLADNSVLLLDVPAGERWGITHWYVAVGDVTEERLVQEWAPFEGRVFHLPVEIVDRPVGGVVYPGCCYWWEQKGLVSYLELLAGRATYGAMAACGAGNGGGGGGNPVTPTDITNVQDYYNFGNRGSATTVAGASHSADGVSTASTYTNAAPHTIVSRITGYFLAAHTNAIVCQINWVSPSPGPATMFASIRYMPGSTAVADGGTEIDAGEINNVPDGEGRNLTPHQGSGYTQWAPPADGTYTVFAQINCSGPWKSWDTIGYTSTTFNTTVYDQGTTTYTGDDLIAVTAYADLVAGTQYVVQGGQVIKGGAPDPVTVEIRVGYGQVTIDTVDAATLVGSSTQAVNTDTTFLMGGVFTATQTGTHAVVMRVYSDGPFSDDTDTDHPRSIIVDTL